MAEFSSLLQNTNVNNDETENVMKKFPYKALHDLAMKLKAAEGELVKQRKFYETKIANMFEIKSSHDNDVAKLKQVISDLVYENNRYHLALSNCTFCSSDDPVNSDVSSTCRDISIEATAPISFASDPALST